MTKYICGGEKYEVGGPKLDTIGLPVFPEGLPASIEVEGYTLTLKTAFHVSLVAMGKIIEKHNVTTSDFAEKVTADFCEFAKDNPVDFLRFTGEFRFMAEDEKRAVVAMCDVSNLDKFFELLNATYALNLEYPPTHVTLYTLQPNVGIFMVDSGDKSRLTKIIPPPVTL